MLASPRVSVFQRSPALRTRISSKKSRSQLATSGLSAVFFMILGDTPVGCRKRLPSLRLGMSSRLAGPGPRNKPTRVVGALRSKTSGLVPWKRCRTELETRQTRLLQTSLFTSAGQVGHQPLAAVGLPARAAEQAWYANHEGTRAIRASQPTSAAPKR